MSVKILTFSGYLFGLLSIVFAYLSYSVWNLPYNEMGRYYDPINSIVYHHQSLEIYTLIAGD